MASSISTLPTHFSVAIDPLILRNFPGTKVGFLLARVVVHSKPSGAEEKFLSALKQSLVPLMASRGITSSNYESLPVCQSWARTFTTFKTDDDKRTTVANLLRRVTTEADKVAAAALTGKTIKADLGKISNFVDFYNAVSVEQLTPMGALNLRAIRGDITLRYGQAGETFIPLGRETVVHPVTRDHVVYADSASVLTWLWNYRDAMHCAVPRDSAVDGGTVVPDYILLFADQCEASGEGPIEKRCGDAEAAILRAAELIHNIGGEVLFTEFLNAKRPQGTYYLSADGEEVTVTPSVTLADCEAAAKSSK